MKTTKYYFRHKENGEYLKYLEISGIQYDEYDYDDTIYATIGWDSGSTEFCVSSLDEVKEIVNDDKSDVYIKSLSLIITKRFKSKDLEIMKVVSEINKISI